MNPVIVPSHFELTAAQTRFGRLDPTCVLNDRLYARAFLTPEGPGVLTLVRRDNEMWDLQLYGQGSDWLSMHAHDILGFSDFGADVSPQHQAVSRAQRRVGTVRFVMTRSPYQELLTAVLGQRITARQAATQWRQLVLLSGQTAPGPLQLLLPPSAEWLASMPFHTMHRIGVEQRRATVLRRVAENSDFLERLSGSVETPASQLTASLRAIPGVGAWTAAVAGFAAFRDTDAVRVGDFHIKNTVSWALSGRARGSDEEMLELLAPYEGQRERVVRWLQMDGWQAPKRGPRRPILDVSRL